MGDPRPARALTALAALALVAACQRPKAAEFSAADRSFSCEVPSGWTAMDPSAGTPLSLISPDAAGEVPAALTVKRAQAGSAGLAEREAESTRRAYEGDKAFAIEAVRAFQAGPFPARGYSFTRKNVDAQLVHRWRPGHPAQDLGPPPAPVEYRETHVYIEAPGGMFIVSFEAPLALYDAHRPEFERLLSTFRVLAQGR